MSTLQLRTTRKYRAGWAASEDQWEDIGTVTRLTDPVEQFHPDDDPDDDGSSSRCFQIVQVSDVAEIDAYNEVHKPTPEERAAKDAALEKVQRALADTFSTSNCRHEHDCCGCWSYYAEAHHMRDGVWVIAIHGTMNI